MDIKQFEYNIPCTFFSELDHMLTRTYYVHTFIYIRRQTASYNVEISPHLYIKYYPKPHPEQHHVYVNTHIAFIILMNQYVQ